LKLRREHPALPNSSDFLILYADKISIYWFTWRVAAAERIVVAVNPSGRACTAALGEVLEHALFHPLLAQGVALPERQVGDGPGIFRHLLT
jgi:hypothetical protein